MFLTVKNSNISLSVHPNNVQETITFQVLPEGRDKLTIADKFIFSSRYPDKDKTEISGRFSIKKIEPEYAERYKLNSEKIGYLSFYEAFADEYSRFSSPAQVIFTVFVQEEQFRDIKQAVLIKSPVKHLAFSSAELNRNTNWEPSHYFWKSNSDDPKLDLERVYISDFSIGFGDDFDDEYWDGRDDSKSEIMQVDEAKPSTLKLFFDEYKYFAIVIIVVLIFILNR